MRHRLSKRCYKPSTNGHQIVPQQHSYQNGRPLKAGSRFSATRKWKNTFSYKRPYGASEVNGVNPLTTKSELHNVIRHRFSYADATKSLRIPEVGHQYVTKKDSKTSNSVKVSSIKATPIGLSAQKHDSLVSSIEKIIVDALGEIITDKPISSQKEKSVISKAAVESKIGVVKTLTTGKSSQENLKSNFNKITGNGNINTTGASNIIEKKPSVASSKDATPGTKETVAKIKGDKQKKVRTTEAVSAEVVTTPEPVEPMDAEPYPANEYCICMTWCPPGTMFRGYCGHQWSYGIKRSMCCLSLFGEDDD